MKIKLKFTLFILVTGVMIFLVLNKHSHSNIFTYHAEIWSDKAGYYIYLPAAFEYGFSAKALPDSIEEKTGYGFELDLENNTIKTKYTMGVALMQAPFYLIARGLSQIFDTGIPAFNIIHHRSIGIAAVFYHLAGLTFLYFFLCSYFSRNVSLITVSLILLATNLFYYGISETGMSHTYNFFLFSAFLYFIKNKNFLNHARVSDYFIFGILSGLIILIRPINVIFLLIYFFLDVKNLSNIGSRVQNLLARKEFLVSVVSALCIIAPQLLYWKYAYGSYISYSYGDEGFYWASPQILKVLFSPLNGLYLYTPFFLIITLGIIYTVSKGANHGWLSLAVFIVITYVFASWWAWWFGCSFGARSYVEYYALFSLPLAHFIDYIRSKKLFKVIAYALIVLFITYNIRLTYTHDGCVIMKNHWNWNKYYQVLNNKL